MSQIDKIPTDMVLSNCEFFCYENEVWIRMADGKTSRVTESDSDLLREMEEKISTFYPGAHSALQEIYKASSRAYIPEYIRRRFLDKEQFDTLFLQEGEKKAEKACKHGMPSIGIQGINNIGAVETGMIQDIQEVVRVCGVRNVVLMMDSDWDDLHRDITVGDRVDKRPNSFAAAVIKFKQFMASFHNLGIDVEAWWGHVNKDNDFGDGIIETTSDFHIRNFVCDYIKSTAKDTVVREYFISKIDVLLNEKKLQRLEVVKNLMGKQEALKSDMYFSTT